MLFLSPIKENILTYFLKYLKIKHTRSFSRKYFNQHPHKYNLFGLSNMLFNYGIDNICIQIDNKNDISKLECPFIAHIGSDFVIVTDINDTNVSFVWNGKITSTAIDNFNEVWSGVVLLPEINEQSIEPDYKEHRKNEVLLSFRKYSFWILLILLVTTLYFCNHVNDSIARSILLIINLIGVAVGYLLIGKQINGYSNYVDKICSLFMQNDCNDILESNASKIFGISWSEIGFSYFFSNTIITILFPTLIPYLMIINLFTLPYSFWSIWYQKVKAKQWCVLCLIVQILFWCIFLLTIFGENNKPIFEVADFFSVAFIYLIPFLFVNLLLPGIIKGNRMEIIEQELNSIKVNDAVFVSLLKQQPYYDIDFSVSKICWGNPNANIRITILTNPHCGPCGKMHDRVEKLLGKIGSDIYIQFIMSFFTEELSTSNKYLIGIYLESPIDVSRNIFKEWFEKGRYEKDHFMLRYKININNIHIDNEFNSHNKWLEKTKLVATPTVLINGYKLPGNYKIEDVEFLLDSKIN